MSRILAIDPGPTQSAWLVWDCQLEVITHPTNMGITPNPELLGLLRMFRGLGDAVVIEQVASYGMPVGAEVFETVYWSGRFAEASQPAPVHRLTRLKVKQAICHDSRANDATIRQALIDRFTEPGQPAIGLKANPGPLYGIHHDVWQALAVAVAWADGAR